MHCKVQSPRLSYTRIVIEIWEVRCFDSVDWSWHATSLPYIWVSDLPPHRSYPSWYCAVLACSLASAIAGMVCRLPQLAPLTGVSRHLQNVFFGKLRSVFFFLWVCVTKHNFSNFYLKFLVFKFSWISCIFASFKCDFASPTFQIKTAKTMFITQIFKGNETHHAIISEKYFVVNNIFYLKKNWALRSMQ